MNENNIPKWQRELRSFLGIKSGIILEGNVYDEYPRFSYSAEGAAFLDMDNLDQAVLSLVDEASTISLIRWMVFTATRRPWRHSGTL